MCGYLITIGRFHSLQGLLFTLFHLHSLLLVFHLLPRQIDHVFPLTATSSCPTVSSGSETDVVANLVLEATRIEHIMYITFAGNVTVGRKPGPYLAWAALFVREPEGGGRGVQDETHGLPQKRSSTMRQKWI